MLFLFMRVSFVFILLFFQSFILMAVCAYALGSSKSLPHLDPPLEKGRENSARYCLEVKI